MIESQERSSGRDRKKTQTDLRESQVVLLRNGLDESDGVKVVRVPVTSSVWGGKFEESRASISRKSQIMGVDRGDLRAPSFVVAVR